MVLLVSVCVVTATVWVLDVLGKLSMMLVFILVMEVAAMVVVTRDLCMMGRAFVWVVVTIAVDGAIVLFDVWIGFGGVFELLVILGFVCASRLCYCVVFFLIASLVRLECFLFGVGVNLGRKFMVMVCWLFKGGSGIMVVAAVLVLVLVARYGGALFVDLVGDVLVVLGMFEFVVVGAFDWLVLFDVGFEVLGWLV